MLKKRIFSLFISLLLLIVPITNFAAMESSAPQKENGSVNGGAVLDSLFSDTVETAEKEIEKTAEKLAQASQPQAVSKAVEKSIKEIKKGTKTYRKVFKNVYFVGDSLMNGLEIYNILNSKKLITQVSASLYHLSDNMEKIIKLRPPVLILHYGINMLSTEKVLLDNFINMYSKLIKQLKKELPDCRIIVSLIFPVDRSVAKAVRFGKINTYNKRLIKMCKSLEVEYLDSRPAFEKGKKYYGSDGIHLAKAFYEKHWLKFIMREKGIY